MGIAAGIVSILIGLTSLAYVGIFGGILGSAAGWLGSFGASGNAVSNWADMVKILCWLSPILTEIAGGIIAFANPRFGGVVIAGSSFSHWYLLGFSTVGNYFVLPLAAAALLAFFARRSTPPPVYSRETTATPIQTDSAPNETAAGFDRAKWNALLRYDKDIALIAEKLQPLGEKWVDEFASSYLALNDKTYLPQIEEKLVAAAKAEAEENERQRIHEEEQQTAFLQEQERLVQARKQQSALRRNRFWGTPRKKFLTIACGVVMALLAVLSLWQMKSAEPVKYVEPTKTAQPKTYSDPFAYCEAVVNKDGGPEGFEDIRYTGPNPPPAVINAMNKAFPNYSGITVTWRCMDANVYGCFVGASGRGCRIAATDERQLAAIKQFCEQNPNNDFVPNAVNYSDSDWRCDGTTPVKTSTYPTDKRGYMKDNWYKILPARPAAFHPNITPQVKRKANTASGTLSIPANGDSPHITIPHQHNVTFTGQGFLMHIVYQDGHECVIGQGNCQQGSIRYAFVHDVSGRPNKVTYQLKRIR